MDLTTKLSHDIILQEVYFVMEMYKGLKEQNIPIALVKAEGELVYHNHPPLPLTTSDTKKKNIFPQRTLWHTRVDKIKRDLMKFFN